MLNKEDRDFLIRVASLDNAHDRDSDNWVRPFLKELAARGDQNAEKRLRQLDDHAGNVDGCIYAARLMLLDEVNQIRTQPAPCTASC